MKKIKEINLNPSADQPYYPGSKTNIPIGYTGGVINNADSSISRRMQAIANEEEEQEEEMILNKRKKKNGKFSLLDTLNEISDNENIEVEDFHEIELEDDIEEQVTMAGGGIGGVQAPLGREKRGRISDKEYLQKEQIERMRILEAYHQKTTNKLK